MDRYTQMDLTSFRDFVLAKEIELKKRQADVLTIERRLRQLKINVECPPPPKTILQEPCLQHSPFDVPDVLHAVPDIVADDKHNVTARSTSASQSVNDIIKLLQKLKEPTFDDNEISETNRDMVKMWELGIQVPINQPKQQKFLYSRATRNSKMMGSYYSPSFREMGSINMGTESLNNENSYVTTPQQMLYNKFQETTPSCSTPASPFGQSSITGTLSFDLHLPKEFSAYHPRVTKNLFSPSQLSQQIPKEPELVSSAFSHIQEQNCFNIIMPESPKLSMNVKWQTK